MPRRNKIILIIAIIILLILAILLFWFRFRTESVPGTVVVVSEEPVVAQEETEIPVPGVGEAPIKPERTVGEGSVETLAKTFAERYGSYSNESEFQNLRDLETLMTPQFAAKTEGMIASTEVSDMYYGVTTRVVSMNITAFDEEAGVAEVSVLTQREEAIGSPLNTDVKYQTLVLEMALEGGAWLVDDAVWE